MTDPLIEGSLDETAHLATALAMAISGMGKLAVDEGDEQRALQALADEVRFKAHDAQKRNGG